MISLLFAAALSAPSTAPAAPPSEIVVRSSAARPAIERILRADNLDVDNLPASEVADTMALIPRGVAPPDFWRAYQQHVRAWQDYADAKQRGRAKSATDISMAADGAAVADARRRINSTFDRVVEIARRYGARMPLSTTTVQR